MDIADQDESGTIDSDEFKEFIQKVDESKSEEEIKAVFDSQDEGSSGELSIEQFGMAFFEMFKK